ncbi:conserved hypothetical protein [Candidatus Sulfobium mesophilum]|uniref:TIGR02757 family protein n=1 Tax=Candidatus Sulfobium mesophilum TaxID=2016548 RepID=A0A2U3QJE4_9BACT|nr:conserved hypothetical protein [Candidatus Sulfobium mesophilum]
MARRGNPAGVLRQDADENHGITNIYVESGLNLLFMILAVIIICPMNALKKTLDRFYREYDFQGRISYDPIKFPHRYNSFSDVEVSAFIASCLAYGKVGLFSAVVEKILSVMGESPYEFLLGFDLKRDRPILRGIKYRFNENDDIICLLFLLRRILEKYSSLENAFRTFYNPDDPDIGNALAGLIGLFLSINTTEVYRKDLRPPGLLQFLPSPLKGSACKRANLFLRWMVRDRDIDFGIWKGIPKSKLVIPLDTHIARISRCLGFTGRKSQDWKMAVEVTSALRKLDPEDPLKYDFALCHHGISGMCRGRKETETCRGCALRLK